MRLLESPPGEPFERPDNPDYEAPAAFGPGRRYWTLSGQVLIGDGQVLLVMPETEQPTPLVAAAPVGETTVIQKPWWSFGVGLYLSMGEARYTVEPEPFYPKAATPGRIRRARAAAKEFERALEAAKGPTTD